VDLGGAYKGRRRKPGKAHNQRAHGEAEDMLDDHRGSPKFIFVWLV